MKAKKQFDFVRVCCGILLIGIILTVMSISVSAAVLFTDEAFGDADTIYVAGNPDFYPVEYYDADTKSYVGIMPKVLKIVSEETGYDFTYIHAGRTDQRERLAENNQVELVSAYLPDNDNMSEALFEEQVVFSVPIDGEMQKVCLAFTEIAPAEFIQAVQLAVDKISDAELTGIAISCAMENKRGHFPIWVLSAVSAFCVLAFVFAVILFFKLEKTQKQEKMDKMLDFATGIGNKAYFTHYFENFISDKARILYDVAYVAFDIQHINKYYGEDEAENILRYAADVLTRNAADTDIVARITGGGFAVAFQSNNMEDAKERIERLLKQLNDYDKKYNRNHEVKFCAGVYSLDTGDRSSETVLYNAQQGYLYAVEHHLPFSFINERLLRKAEEQIELQKQITAAFQNHEFRVYLQFIVDKNTGIICGAETLSRWQHPQRGLLSPKHYIDFMKETENIGELDFYMFEESCRQLHEWGKGSLAHLWISCNFTRITISSENFMERILSIAEKYQFARSRLVIEITENAVESNETIAFRNIVECKKAGFCIALDDFGDGYTSFRNLCDYAVDYVKIDRSIVLKAENPNGKALLDGMIALAHSMQMKVLCEGIETEMQNELICGTECDMIQGYYYSRNIPQEEAAEFLKQKGISVI